MALCSGIKADGSRCRAAPLTGSQWCHAHHPDKADERRLRAQRGGKRGGRGRPQAELGAIKQQLLDLADHVLDGSVERADAAVVGQLLNIVIRAITTELQVKEQTQLVAQMEELEEALARYARTGTDG